MAAARRRIYTISTLRKTGSWDCRLQSELWLVCVCGFLITKEQFITQAIDEKIKAVKGKQAFYFICILHKFCGSLQK